MQCLHCLTHAFGIAQTALSLRVNIVLQDVLTNVRLVDRFGEPQFPDTPQTNHHSLHVCSAKTLTSMSNKKHFPSHNTNQFHSLHVSVWDLTKPHIWMTFNVLMEFITSPRTNLSDDIFKYYMKTHLLHMHLPTNDCCHLATIGTAEKKQKVKQHSPVFLLTDTYVPPTEVHSVHDAIVDSVPVSFWVCVHVQTIIDIG